MKNQTYFAIENAINQIADGKSQHKTRLANMILERLSAEKKPAANIIDAIWQATMLNAKFNQEEDVKCKAVGAIHKPELYDISFYGFIQQIMDRACWNARAGLVARRNADAQDEQTSGGNGLDFATDLEDQVGFDLSTPEGIRDQVNDIFDKLTLVSADIAQARALDAEPVHMFSPSERQEDGTWVVTLKIDNWDEAVVAMNDIVDLINDRPDVVAKDIYAPRKYA